MDGQHLLQTSFEPTEIMSTYLLAFVVCDFGFIGTEPTAEVLVIIYSTYSQNHTNERGVIYLHNLHL